MSDRTYNYVIVGGGTAGAMAVGGIREMDKDAPILLIASEKHLPYDRPPLSKRLWTGKMEVNDIFINDKAFYEKNKVDLLLGVKAESLDPGAKTVTTSDGEKTRYEKLLLATGGIPRRLDIPGGDLEGIYYFRRLDDFEKLHAEAAPGRKALVIGGGFIGSELAAALNVNKVEVTLIFPSPYICHKVFPERLGRAMTGVYESRGVSVIAGDRPVNIEKSGAGFVTTMAGGLKVESDIIVAGLGITPDVSLAAGAGLSVGDGVMVDECLRTTAPDIFAAGDIANFLSAPLGVRMRVEHWHNAWTQGKLAGRNMAGAGEPLDYMPYFFSDLFEFGYEAYGEIDSRLDTFADWEKEDDTGVVYYMQDGVVRGVMTCNIFEKMDEAEALIRKGGKVAPESLKGLIKSQE